MVLENDLDLGNRNWTPIGLSNDKSFKGTFDGGNHTIANLKVDLTGKESVNAGLFGSAWQGDDVLKKMCIRDSNRLVPSRARGRVCRPI